MKVIKVKLIENILDNCIFDNSLDDVIAIFTEYKNKFSDYHNLTLSNDSFYDDHIISLSGERYETSEEIANRLKEEAAYQEIQQDIMKDRKLALLQELAEIEKNLERK